MSLIRSNAPLSAQLRRFALFFLPLFLGFSLILYWGISSEERTRLDKLAVREHSRIEIISDRMQHSLMGPKQDLRFIARTPAILNFAEHPGTAQKKTLENLLLALASEKKFYDQLRYLDSQGQEIVRINYNDGAPVSVPVAQLQNKSDRYWFSDTIKLNQGELFISPLDLNIEQNKLEIPYKPMIRFGTPIFDTAGHKQGTLVFNYLAGDLLDDFKNPLHSEQNSNVMLLNSDGYFLHADQAEDEWGFMTGHKERTFARDFPEIWPTVLNSEHGTLNTRQGQFFYATVYPLVNGGSSSYQWKIVSFISTETLKKINTLETGEITLMVGVYLLFAAIAFAAAQFSLKRRQIEKSLRDNEQRLNFSLNAIHTGSWELNLLDHHAHRTLEHDKIFGYDELLPDWTYQIFLQHVLAEDRAEVDQSFQHALTTQGSWDFECRIRRLDGAVRWIWATGSHQFDEAGQPRLISGVVQDITERKQIELENIRLNEQLEAIVAERTAELELTLATLRTQEQRYRLLVDGVRDVANIMLDPRGYIISWNRGAERLKGYPETEVLGRYFSLFHTPEDVIAGKPQAELADALATGSFETEGWRVRRDGTRFWANVILTVLYDEHGKVLGFSKITRDITEQKNSKQMLVQAKEAAELANRTKDTFLANMSHELRTPLNAIIGFSEVLKDGMLGEVTEQQREYLGDIYQSGEHLLSLINDILDIAKIESGEMVLNLEPTSINNLLQNSLSMVKEKAMGHRLKLTLNVDTGIPKYLADQRKLKQIVYNLLSNAVKFTPDGGEVTLAAHLTGDRLELTVTDTGIGISPEDQLLLFQPFKQIDSELSRLYQGTGLGLSLTKSLVELHGGTISVQSEAGKGSCFCVSLPWCQKETNSSVNITPNPPPVHPVQNLEGQTQRSVLVIEDNRESAKLLTYYLELEGLRVTHLSTGEQALEWLTCNQPDLITLDLLLPGIDGWEVLACIKQIPKLAEIPVLIVSILMDKQRGFALGASQVLQKPLSYIELSTALTTVGILPASTGHILMVDDDPVALELISLYLKQSGHRISVGHSGAEGIALAHKGHPDVILLDLMMPEVSGFDVVLALKDDPDTATIPIIIITSKLLTEQDRLKLNGHIETILAKSEFNPEILITEIRRALGKKG